MLQARFLIYVMGLIAGGLTMSGYATFDPETLVLDIEPFNVEEFVLVGVGVVSNFTAALAVFFGWGKK
ncbi:MAG: hypothetical protein U5K75_12065 [Ahrensia sp.]|nr:hypothetical protein [Ahrensia sp.]